ncbi:MAG: thermonuclease family protein [Dehalococcoidia bacterium]|nr:thermonuclease family protein [Dehalococcoidia bacterium]
MRCLKKMRSPLWRQLLCLLYLTLAVSLPVHAYPARVVAVADGDTITIEPIQGGGRAKVRLHGIDCPEKDQAYGQAATVFVIDAVLFKVVDVQPTPQGTDRYGRIVAVVEIPGKASCKSFCYRRG